MHDTAYEHGRLFFDLYITDATRTVVDLGSQDVNGTLRDHCPHGVLYIGLDVMPAKGVDVVLNPTAPLPIASDSIDAVVTSSAFEHDVCFWETFLELIRILRPGGVLYVNAPSNDAFHRYPLDCWRFYPDAGVALVQWAARRGMQVELVESFIGLPKAERWADFVAVFRKAGGNQLVRKGRIADHAPAINIHSSGRPPNSSDIGAGNALEAESQAMPDMTIATELRSDLAEAQRRSNKLAAELTTSRAETLSLRHRLATIDHRTAELDRELAASRDELAAVLASTSWRLTGFPRWIMSVLRGR